jgi:hypothetical protein
MFILNKITLGSTLLLISFNVFAKPMECPPASALHHPDIGKNWVLDKKYIDQGWFPGEDFEPVKNSPLKELPDGVLYTVQLDQSGYWKATCSYTVPGNLPTNENDIRVSTIEPFDDKKVPQPPFTYFQAGDRWIYSCSTTSAKTSRHCIWDIVPVPPMPAKVNY